MRISRVAITNFRNFHSLDVHLAEHAVIVGENKVGKSNLLFALRLVLDPSLPDSSRALRDEDFWDELPRPLGRDDRITVSVELADFEQNPNQLAVLAEHLVQPVPMVARLTYVWQPLARLKGAPKKEADYEFFVYGGDRVENRVGYEVRHRIPMDLMHALRDCEGDLARWARSPLRPLLDKAAETVDHDGLVALAKKVDSATNGVAGIKEVKAVATDINKKLVEMVGSAQALETQLRFSPTEAERLIRSLRLFIDGGRRGVSEASLGSANLLYLALKLLEYDQLANEGAREHTFLAIEEPEAHLHPQLQRLVFRNYLATRTGQKPASGKTTVLMTTHSPHVASVTPIRSLVLLRRTPEGNASEAVSTAKLPVTASEVEDLERYLDVTRAEVLFAKAVILVEGDAERFLIPSLARRLKQPVQLDERGITVCSVAGTMFAPYLKLVGPKGLGLPFTVLTDMDPQQDSKLGIERLRHQILPALGLGEPKELEGTGAVDANVALLAETEGVFLNEHTLEVDLFRSGYERAFDTAMKDLSDNGAAKRRMTGWAGAPMTLKPEQFLDDINAIGKGRFAQRLAALIDASKDGKCPPYIEKGLRHVGSKCY